MIRNINFSVSSQVISLLTTMLLLVVTSRYINPSIYGEFALINAVHLLFFPLLDSGFSRAYLKTSIKSNRIDSVYFSAYLFMLFIYIILFISVVRIIYGVDSIKYAIFFVISAVFTSLSQQRINILTKALREDSLFLITSISTISSALMTLWLAINDYGIYALLAQPLLFQLSNYIVARLINQTDFKFIGLNGLLIYKNDFRFGFQVLTSRMITAYAIGFDKIILSFAYPINVIGLYTRAFELARLPNRTIGVGLSSSVLAYFSSIMEEESRRYYSSTFELLLHVSTFPLIVLIIWAEYLIPFVLGNDWSLVIPFVLPLSIWGTGKILHGFLLLIYTNEKAISEFLKMTLVGFLFPLLILLILVLVNVDIFAALYAYSISYILIWVYFVFCSLHKIGYRLHITRIILPVLIFVVVGIFSYFFGIKSEINPLLVMSLYSLVLAVSYYWIFISRGPLQNKLFKR